MARPRSELVTIFGGSGFIGTQVVREFARRGWRVRAAVRRPHLAVHLRPQGDVGQIQVVACDIGDEAQVGAALEGADAAVNLVGVLFETPSRRFQKLHAEAAGRIARACAERGINRFVQMSALGADAASESAYARTKAEGETLARTALPSTVVMRPSVVFGRGDDFLNRFAAMATWSPALPLPGGGETKFQPVHVADVAEAVVRAALDPASAGRSYELGGPETWTFRRILEFVLAETGRQRPLVPLPWPTASLIGTLASPMTWIGLKPPLTADQVELLKIDNVVSGQAPGLSDLGITPTAMAAVAQSYLWRYRVGGQFAEVAPA